MIGILRLIKGETIKILVGQEGAGGVVGVGNTPLIIAGGGGGNRSTEIKACVVGVMHQEELGFGHGQVVVVDMALKLLTSVIQVTVNCNFF